MHLSTFVLTLVLFTSCNVTGHEPRTREDNQHKKVSDLWKEKYHIFFRMVDVNEDGMLSRQEYVEETANRAGQVLSSWRAKAVYGVMSADWQAWAPSQRLNLSFDEFLQIFESGSCDNTMIFSQLQFCWDWFYIIDADCNGEVSSEEYANLFIIFRSKILPEEPFRALDHDGNGVLGVEEYVSGCYHYIFDENDKATARFYGLY